MGALHLERLSFDPADTADSANIGAYLRAGSDGDLISSTNVSGKEGLDINVINASLTVSASDLDIRDLTHVSDSVKIGDGTDFLLIDGSGRIGVTATDLDIRDLVHTADSVKVGDGTDFLAVNADGSINAVVSATNLDIRDLSHTQDSVKVGDGTDFLAVAADGSIGVSQVGTWNVNLTDDSVADDAADTGNPFKVGGKAYTGASALSAVSDGDRVNLAQDLYRRVYINDAPNISLDSTAVTVGTTAVALPTTALAGRTRIMIQNVSGNPIFVGPSDVTTSGATQGLQIAKGATLALELGQGVSLYGIAGSAGNSVIVFEQA